VVVTHDFPGGTAVSRLLVYDWPTADGKRGGSPHLHTASTEAYVVLAGSGVLETLSGAGYGEQPLHPGTVLWFTPGTVHRLVNHGDLEILVVMQNAGLPETGDAVLTFPPKVLADPGEYAATVTLPPTGDEKELAAAARRRRDLAIEGYLVLRDRVREEGPDALAELYQSAAALVRDRAGGWRHLWRDRPLAQAVTTGDHLEALDAGEPAHLAASAVQTADRNPRRFGMCGRLSTWEIWPG